MSTFEELVARALDEVASLGRISDELRETVHALAASVVASMSAVKPVRVGTCSRCEHETVLQFVGVFDAFEDVPAFSLWQCLYCGTSVSGRSFLPASEEARIVAKYAVTEVA